MRFDVFLFLTQCIIFCNRCDFATAKALVGPGVERASENEFSFIVSITRVNIEDPDPGNDHFCTGALISKRNVLTGAHCLEDETLMTVEVIVGTVDLRQGTRYKPMWWMTYNEWATAMNIIIEYATNDVAIIQLTQNVPDNIKPAEISIFQNSDLHGLEVQTAGWGQTENEECPLMLRKVNLKIIPNEECNARATSLQGESIKIHPRILCSIADPYAIIAFGDSGGPIFLGNKIVGINYGTCPLPEVDVHPGKVNVHFGIDYYRNFIQAVNR